MNGRRHRRHYPDTVRQGRIRFKPIWERYEALDSTYEAVTDYLEEKKLEGKDLFIEQYMKDPLSTPENDLVIEIYVPLK